MQDTETQRHYLQRAKGFFKAEVYVTRLDSGERVVCKDYSRFERNPLAALLARWLVRHELLMLQRLQDWPHAPRVYPGSSPLLLVQEYVPGKLLSQQQGGGAAIYSALFLMLVQLHQMGITHNDIRGTNIILRDDNFPILIDFTAASSFPLIFGLAQLVRWLRLFDLRHLIKLKRNLDCPIRPHEARLLKRAGWQQKLMKFWKKGILPRLKRQS